MSAHQYPFIDVAVHERVRLPFARGEAVVLFSIDMRQVLWSNGRGAALFGHGSIYDFLDAPVPEGDVVFRQLQTAARQLGHSGLGRNLLLRIGTGYRGLPVSAHVERITLAPGQDAVLFSTPAAGKHEPLAERAASLLGGFDDPDTHMAVLDGDGGILAASSGFAALGISEDARRRMVAAARREADGLVKRPVPTGKGLLPAALGRISTDPALNLLFAVETILGHMDADQDATAAAEMEQPVPAETALSASAAAAIPGSDMGAPGPAGNDTRDDADQKAPAHLPDGARATASAEEEPDAANTAVGGAPVTERDTAEAPPEADEARADADLNTVAEPAPSAMAADRDAGLSGPFGRASRPVRFVWKIDAEGHFSELSGEFADVVGPHAADVIGLPFTEVAKRFDFDRDGTIAELLRRRDTWSGKTIHWPVEGTGLRVPVDLAALPTYSRSREFDGFRGFGIVRTADAIEDEHALGLAIAGPAKGEAEAAASQAGAEAPGRAEADATAPPVLDELLAEEAEAEAPLPEDARIDTAATGDDAAGSARRDDAPEAETGIHPDDDFRGERPALRLVDTSARKHSGKVVQLDDRRGGVGALTSGEQAAFREIARQLGETFGKRRSGDLPAAPVGSDAAPGDIAPSTVAKPQRDDVDDGRTAASTGAAPEDRDEIPGLEVGEHADDVPAKGVSITGPRTAMDYGLTASVVDALPVALLIHAGDLLIHANPEFLGLTGYGSLEELADAGGLEALLDRPGAEDGAPEGTMLLRHADATSPVAVNARLQSVRWESGTALMLALSPVASPVASPVPAANEAATGISDRAPEDDESEALAALRDEASELRSILETATDGVVVVDQEGEIRSINRSASALFNYDEDEIRGKPFAILFAHESQKAVIDYLAGLAGHGVASVLNDGREVIGREASGGFIPLFMTMGRLSSSSGYCAVIRDITQWKRTEEELRNAKRAAETANAHKSEFLARVSHEIRTPLNAIIGFSDMMAGERFGPIGHPRYVEYANDIGRSGRHVLDIVNDLLDISKIEAGEMELDFTAVGLNETVSEAVSLVQPQANGQRVIIRTSLSTSVPPVVADLRSIKQIALNILANAIRFTPSGGQIVVSTSYESNGSVVLRIRDTGVGMTRSELEQAMKPFRQVTTGARKRGDGTGLGLPLTKAMVDANRAHFAISSSPNEGTLVEVTFPSPRVLAV